MEQSERIHELRVASKELVLNTFIKHYEEAVENNDSEMVSALSESLKAVFKS